MEKTFMDYYLLKKHRELVDISEKGLKELNSQEVLLLVHYFANNPEDHHRAKALAQYV